MRPPFCCVCDEPLDPRADSALLTFADYEPLPPGITGHPRGVDWFCPRHAPRAQELTHLTLSGAIEQIASS